MVRPPLEGRTGHDRWSLMGPVEYAVLEDCVTVMATPEGEESLEFREALRVATSEGCTQLQEEYFDKELDRYVYVFTPLEDE